MSKTPETFHFFSRVAAGFVVACLVLGVVGWLIWGDRVGGFDGAVRGGVRQMQSPMWTALLLAVTRLGSTVYLWVAGAGAGLVFLILRWWRPLGLLIVVMAGQAALHYGFKLLVARPRPSALINYPAAMESHSFPSGHAVGSLCLFAAVAWAVSNRVENVGAKIGVWMAAGILIFLVGLSRVYIGVHYPTDVLAGWLAAAIWTAAVMSTDRTDL
jgi:undecaprenyl-diphosphatase